MPRFAPLPAALDAVFTRSDATAFGVSSRRLLKPDVERIGFALYRRRDDAAPSASPAGELGDADPPGNAAERWRQRHLGLLLARRGHLPDSSFLIGRSAAVLWGLPVPPGPDQRIEIARPAPMRALRREDFRARQLTPRLIGVVEHRGLAVTDPATTWAMLAPRLGLHDAVALGDAVIRRPRIPGTSRLKRPPHAELADLRDLVATPHRAGASLLREALGLLVTSSASPPETHLRLRLREWGAPEPALDHDVRDQRGQLIGCSEIAYPLVRLALEYEGDHHRTGISQWNRDIEKYRRYEQNGWEVIRISATLLYRRRDELREQIFEALTRRGWVFQV